MPRFSIQLRAHQNLTKDLEIEAETEAEALLKIDYPIQWDVSDPEDFQVEAINQVPD